MKTDKEDHLETLLHVPSNMELSAKQLREPGVTSASELVLQLKKSLYGLKQAGRLWSQLLYANLLEASFNHSITDMCLHFKRDDHDLVIVGVDDLLAKEDAISWCGSVL